MKESALQEAKRLIEQEGGVIRTSEALRIGIHPRTLYALRDSGVLEQLSRGVYRLANGSVLSNPDLVTVAVRVPQAVLCLISALAFHEITTQIPNAVYIALARGAEVPRLDYPPLAVHHFSGESFTAGVEQHPVDGVTLRVYSPEKTLADCFKFRNRIGMDVVLEALRLYRLRREFKPEELLEFARICRVEKIMMPYLDSLV